MPRLSLRCWPYVLQPSVSDKAKVRVQRYLADLHVHTGSAAGQPVKITASRGLTVRGALAEAADRKGLSFLGLVDAIALPVQHELSAMVDAGELTGAAGGGLLWRSPAGRTVLVVPGAEIELLLRGVPVHFLALLPDLSAAARLSDALVPHQRNRALGCQRAHELTPAELRLLAGGAGGLVGLAHAFTPHRGFYGTVETTWRQAYGTSPGAALDFVEMGLSADATMADRLSELRRLPLLANSDAHSLQSIGREVNLLSCRGLSFAELVAAIRGGGSRGITAYYGLDPRLGKYHRTTCARCGWQAAADRAVSCPQCGAGAHVTAGVLDRVLSLADTDEPNGCRAPYVHQVPLLMLPGVGEVARRKLLFEWGSEATVLHDAELALIAEVAGQRAAQAIAAARAGRIALVPGGGGRFGRVSVSSEAQHQDAGR